MGTRGIIGQAHDSGFTGRYVNMDSNPSWTGKELLKTHQLLGSPEKVIEHAIQGERRGFWDNYAAEAQVPNGTWIDESSWPLVDHIEDVGAEWAYLLTERGFDVAAAMRPDGRKAIGMFGMIGEIVWVHVGFVAWGSDPEVVDWGRIECGDDLERCTHYAWVHFPEAKDWNIGTAAWLRRSEPGHDDIKVLVDHGQRLTVSGGSRGSADDPNGWRNRQPGDRRREYWWCTVREHRNPVRAFWILKDGRYKLEPGINGIIPTAEGERLMVSGTVL